MSRAYKGPLVRMMSHLHNMQYDRDKVFTQEELAVVTSDDVMSFFNAMVFGDANVPAGHDMAPLHRSNTIKFWKKAISYFMPRRMVPWDDVTQRGNPTRSSALNKLIEYVKRKEVRSQGIASQARRSITDGEYRRIMTILKAEGTNAVQKYGIPAMMNYMFHMIGRINCSTQARLENLKIHDNFNFALKTKLAWSKNVREERDAPWQIVMPSIDPVYCVHISTAVWLEVFMGSSPTGAITPYLFSFSDDVTIPRGGDKSSSMVQHLLQSAIFNKPEFQQSGPLGSHSLRKYAATTVRNKGASKDEKDLRGRWKSSQRISDIYDDVELPFPDAKVAGLLCIGGPCKYVLAPGSNVTNEFLLNHVMTNSAARIGNDVAIVLGRALLWYAFTDNGREDLPTELSERIQDAYQNFVTNDLPEGTNPIKKLPVIIHGMEGRVHIDEIPDELNGQGQQNGANNGGVAATGGGFLDRPLREQLLAMHAQLLASQRDHEDQRRAFLELQGMIRRQFTVINSNFRRVTQNPVFQIHARRVGAGQGEQNGTGDLPPAAAAANNQAATLSPTPRDLHTLWDEYIRGIGGRKAAQLFTAAERGRVKHKFTRRKIVWETIQRLVRSGLSANVAIDRIYEVYGRNNSVTTIINRMRTDKKNRAIPAMLL
eukprot:scaffold1423_cov74-Cylindrotheca_fusiformis.AAC.1